MNKSRIQKTESKAELALVVSERVDLSSIRLADFSARCLAALAPNDLPEELRLSTASSTQEPSGDAPLIVMTRMSLHVAKAGDSTETAPITIEATFELRYNIKNTDGLSKAHYDAFGESNAIFNVWPYWREYVQSATMRLGLPGLTLPLFRLRKSTVEGK